MISFYNWSYINSSSSMKQTERYPAFFPNFSSHSLRNLKTFEDTQVEDGQGAFVRSDNST